MLVQSVFYQVLVKLYWYTNANAAIWSADLLVLLKMHSGRRLSDSDVQFLVFVKLRKNIQIQMDD